MQSNEQPSFIKEILAVLWQLTKIMAPLSAWVVVCIWFARRNLIAAYCFSYGGILLGFIIFVAHSSYKSKIRDFQRKTAGSPSKEEARGLVQSLSTQLKPDRRLSPQVTSGPAAQMPVDYLKPEPRTLADVPEGQEAHIGFSSISVDLQGKTWVYTGSEVYENPGFSKVKVQLVGTNGYLLTISKQSHLDVPFKFTPARLLNSLKSSYAPVIQVIEE